MTTLRTSFEQNIKKLGAQRADFLFNTLSDFAKLHDQARFSNWAVPKASEARRKFVFIAFLLLNKPHWSPQRIQKRLAEVTQRAQMLNIPVIDSFRTQSLWHPDAPVPYLTNEDLAYYSSIAIKYAHLSQQERLLFVSTMQMPQKITSKINIAPTTLATVRERQIA